MHRERQQGRTHREDHVKRQEEGDQVHTPRTGVLEESNPTSTLILNIQPPEPQEK